MTVKMHSCFGRAKEILRCAQKGLLALWLPSSVSVDY